MPLVYNSMSMNPTITMNEPYIAEELPSLDKQMVLNNSALTMYIDRNTLQQFIVIDGTSFTRHNGLTTRTISWETFHDRMERIRALVAPPNNNTLTANNTIQITSGVGRTAEFFMNGTATEINSTGALSLNPTTSLTTISATDTTINAGQIINLITGSQLITTNGATINGGSGRITEMIELSSPTDIPLELISGGVAGRVRLTTNTIQDTEQNNLGDIVQSNKGGSQQQVGSLYNAGIRGQLVNGVGGGTSYGDFLTSVFVPGLIDGLGHSLSFGISLDASKYLPNWGVPTGTGDITSFGCRMVIRLPDNNNFICPFIQTDLPGALPDINYYRITYYGDTFSNPIWVNEGAPTGVQIPALQTNRFYANSTMTIEWSCSLVQNSSLANLAPLAYKCRVIGVDSSQEVIRAEVVCNWLNHPLPQATRFSPAIAYEAGVIQEIISAEFWSNGSPFGL